MLRIQGDADVKSAVVGLDRTRQGNLKLIDLMRRFNKMRLDAVQHQASIVQANGGNIPSNLDSLMMNYLDNYDFMTNEEIQEIEDLKTQQPEEQQSVDDLVDDILNQNTGTVIR